MMNHRFVSGCFLSLALSLPLLVSERQSSVASAQQLGTSVAQAGQSQITGIRLVPSGQRLKLEIDTAGGVRPQVFFSQQGNAWVGDITNAELKLGGNKSPFRQDKPATGIRFLEASQLDKSSVRVQIMGESAAPQGLLAERTPNRLVFDFAEISTVAAKPVQPAEPVKAPVTAPVTASMPKPMAPLANSPSMTTSSAGTTTSTANTTPTALAPSSPGAPGSAPTTPLRAPLAPVASAPIATSIKADPKPSPVLTPNAPSAASATPVNKPGSSPVTKPNTLATAPTAPAPASQPQNQLPKMTPPSSNPSVLTASGNTKPAPAGISVVPQVSQLNKPQMSPTTVDPNQSLQQGRAVAPPVGDIAISTIVPPQSTIDLGSNKTITLTLRNAPVADVLSLLIRRAGLNVVLNDVPADLTVSLDVKESPLQETFDFILRLKELQATRVEQTVFVGRTLPGIDQKIVRNYRINEAKVADIQSFLQSLAAENGPLVGAQLITDERTNSISAIATKAQQGVIAAQIAQLDVREWQVMVDVQVISFEKNPDTRDFSATLGAQSGNFSFTALTTGAAVGAFPPGSPGGANTFNYNPLDNLRDNIAIQLSALETVGLAKSLANPKLICSQNEDCKIEVGTDVVTNRTTTTDPATGQTTQSLVFETAGVTVDLQGVRINGNGFITFENVKPEVSSPSGTFTLSDGTEITNLAKRSLDIGNVRVRDGQTFVLSGLIQESDTSSISKIPLLGDIPILGSLFRSESNSKTRTEVAFLITPYVLRDDVSSVGTPNTVSSTSTGNPIGSNPAGSSPAGSNLAVTPNPIKP